MPILHLVVATAITLVTAQDCPDWRACRDAAVAAASHEENESFHDYAWRAVQKGPKNDPDLMLLLARAQSLSGRPGDALVMLTRLADMGVATDALTSPDFRRVRALAGWPALERRLSEPPSAEPAKAPPPPVPVGTAARAPGAPISEAPPPAALTPSSSAATPAEALHFAATGITPDGLAYDGVSRRFLIADRNARKLAVVDEFSQHVATLAGAQAAFGDIEAIEIDARAGDLWVVSSEPPAAGGGTTLHKLQLISGRVLSTFTVPPALAPARFVDLAVVNGGSILVLDSSGRIFRLKGAALELAGPAPPEGTSLAPGDNGAVYVTTADALIRVDLATRTAAPVIPPADADLSGLSHLRWHRGSLVGVQRLSSGARVVRLHMGRGGRAVLAVDVLDTIDAPTGAITISGNTLYYFASKGAGELVLKKVAL